MRLILLFVSLIWTLEVFALEYEMTSIRGLEATGLYKDFRSKVVADEVRAYEPRFELFSDGIRKRRFIFLPQGQAIVAIDLELWSYPNGTKIWKEFSLQRGSDLIPIETRYMEKQDGIWRFGTYVWSASQDSADLWGSESGTLPINVEIPGANGVSHSVPSFGQCVLCHDQGSKSPAVKSGEPLLGFTSFQLPRTFIEGLYSNQTLVGALIPWQRHRTYALDTEERDVIGYLHANCGHCHNQRRTNLIPAAPDDHFRLNYSIETHSNRNAMHLIQQIGRPIVNRDIGLPNVDASTRLISPGHVDKSMIYLRMKHTEGIYRMPLLGISGSDDAFINGPLRRWIQRLSTVEPFSNQIFSKLPIKMTINNAGE
jgi:hypothetical protein